MTEIEKIERLLNDEDMSYREIDENSLGEIRIEIGWGDWKHSHAYTDFLMSELGYQLDDEIVTEEDGSDCYSSLHYYSKKKK